MSLLETSALTIARGRRTVLAGVSLSLDAGQALHLVGANGSGKTSLLRVLAGLSAPRGGTLARRGTCAFVPEKVALMSALGAGEWLRAMRRLRGQDALDWAAAAVDSGLEATVLRQSSATLSKGMLQRIALLEAVKSDVALLLLDEPFAGLDPDGRDWLARELHARLEGGAAVLVTDHSGAAGERLQLAGRLELRGGEATLVPAAPGEATAAGATTAPGEAAPAGATAARGGAAPPATVVATHPDGRRLERAVGDSDALLRELLDGGWHIEEVRR